MKQVRVFWQKEKFEILQLAICLVVCLMEFITLQYSAMDFSEWRFFNSEVLTLTNLALVMLPNFLLAALCGNCVIVLAFTGTVSFMWSVVNYYVMKFHGMPLAFSGLRSFKTAMDVISGYEFAIEKKVYIVFWVFICEIALIILLKRLMKKQVRKKMHWLKVIPCILMVAYIYLTMFSSWAVKPAQTLGWSWTDAARQYGYMCCLVEDFGNVWNPYLKPEGYNIETLEFVEIQEKDPIEVKPDIIMILNESFWDVTVYSDLVIEENCFTEFYEIENAIHGYVVSPSVGGGTNNSEYELLTGNSMYLLRAEAPFNYVDLEITDNNVVKYLEQLGYETCGMHCGTSTNYSRNIAYPKLGFDQVYLGKENFASLEYYGNRPWTDMGNYHDMIEKYENMGTSPRFVYLLTYQNHGGYQQNESMLDKVHVVASENISENMKEELNEYLTSVAMSIDAYKNLIEYFSTINRPVIVCMVGDHAPSFVTELESKAEFDERQKLVASCTVPYIMWSNYNLSADFYAECMSMTDIMPVLIDYVGLPMSTYYQTIVDLHNDVPVRTSYGNYMDKNGDVFKIDSYCESYEDIMDYYYLEYNALSGGKNYRKEYFEIDIMVE